MKKWMSLSSILSLFLIWYVLYLWVDHPLLLPSISKTGMALISFFTQRDALMALMTTFGRLGVILGISFGVSFMLAYISYKKNYIEAFIHPYMVLFKTVPLVSIILILFVLLDYQITPYIITFLMIMPVLYQAFYTGLKTIDKDYIDVFTLEDNKIITSFRYLYFPMIKTYLIMGVLQSIGLGIKVIVMAEFIIQSKVGLGRYIYQARVNLEYDKIYAITIVLVCLSFLLEKLIKKQQPIT
ncbi:MAG: ABC transporter permease subunit [Acholeplasma sp.]|nr:ABC transporter permease subunit [Acholeplasma sp.]